MTVKGQNETEQTDIIGTMNKAEELYKKHKTIINSVLIGLVVVVGGFFAYKEFVSKPKINDSSRFIAQAQKYFEADSLNLALEGDGINLGFKDIADKYSSTPSGNLASLYTGMCYMDLGAFEAAIPYLKKFSSEDEIIAAKAESRIGDCYVALGKNEEAIKHFLKAGSMRDNMFSATYLLKAASVYESLNKYGDALKQYEKIKYEFPQSIEATAIDPYIERAKELAEVK